MTPLKAFFYSSYSVFIVFSLMELNVVEQEGNMS